MSDRVAVPPLVEAWRAAWQGGDARAVAALYASDGRHESAKVAAAMPELGRAWLTGPAEIEAYAARAFVRVHPLRFDIEDVSESADAATVEYVRHAPGVEPVRVCEVMRWRGGLLVSVRVYHF